MGAARGGAFQNKFIERYSHESENIQNGTTTTGSGGGETTGSASPVTSIGSTGSGTAFSILPPYLVVNIWKRLS